MADVQDRILTGVANVVRDLVGPEANVTRRELGMRWEVDLLPVIFITPGVERDVEDCHENTKFREYQVFVEACYAGNQGFQTNQGTIPDIKNALRQALAKTSLTGASEVWDTRIADQQTYNAGGLANNYKRTIVEVWYSTTETRSV